MIRALVLSPYPTVRAGLRALLQASGEVEVVWEAGAALDLYLPWPLRPDIALVDEAGGPPLIGALEARAPDLGIVLLGGTPTRPIGSTASAPRGYLTRDAGAEEIVAAVRTVAQGLTVVDPSLLSGLLRSGAPVRSDTGVAVQGEQLTPREVEVLQLIAAGLPNKTIAVQLRISEHTAKFHVSSVLAKLDAASRTEAVTVAARRGLLLL